MDSATPTKIASIDQSLVGRKLRVAGRMVSFGENVMLVVDGDMGVLVDIRLCTGNSAEWGRERKGVVMVIGYLERVQTPLPIPPVPPYAAIPAVDRCLVLDALLVTATADLDLAEWNGGIDALEAYKIQ